MQVTKFNLWDLINLVRSPEFKEENKGRYNHNFLDTPDASFHGIETLQEIDTILNAEIQHNDEYRPNERVFNMMPDVCGSVVNIDAYLQGQAEDMYNFTSSDANIVEDLNLYLCVPYSVKAADIHKAAERVKKYIETRPANVSLNINIRSDYRQSRGAPFGPVKTILINVASAEDYLTPQVVNLIGHVMFFRYFICNYIFLSNDSNGTPQQSAEGYTDFLTFNKTW